MHRVNWGQRLVDPQEIFDRATEAVRSLTSGNTTCHLSVVDTMQHVCRTVQGNQPISDDLHLQIDAMALRTVICDRAIEHLQTPQACLNLNYLKPETIYQCLEVAQQNGAVWVSYMSHRSHLDAICTASSLATSQGKLQAHMH